jgi:hypothetical protein
MLPPCESAEWHMEQTQKQKMLAGQLYHAGDP